MLFYEKSLMPHTTGLVVRSPDKHTPPKTQSLLCICTYMYMLHVWSCVINFGWVSGRGKEHVTMEGNTNKTGSKGIAFYTGNI